MKRTLTIWFLATSAIALAATKHPSLVDPESARCEACHRDLIDRGVLHPIVEEGCDNCHTMEKSDGKTFVSFVEEGVDLCLMCHDDKAGWEDRETMHPALEDCTNCHDPHSSGNPRMLKAELPNICLQCHDRREMKGTAHKGQPVQATHCIECHDPHGNDRPHMAAAKNLHPPFADGTCGVCHRRTRTRKARLKLPMPDLCFACHTDLPHDLEASSSVHPPVKEGRCTGCHNPHMSMRNHLLAGSPPDLCYTCHAGIRTRLSGNAHPPAEEDCFTCHAPHASDHPRLIVGDMMEGSTISSLCANCHDLEELKDKHRGASMGSIVCTQCHNPHGSREERLIQDRSIHPPFSEDCENCHAEGTGLAEEEPDLCLMCHDTIAETISSAKIKHEAIEMGCTSCHTPHASGYPKQFKGPQVTVCGECHDMEYDHYHGVIESVGCQACHQPHGGDGDHLLKAAGNELCLACHGREPSEGPVSASMPEGIEVPRLMLSPDGSRGHPVAGHPVSGKPSGKRPVRLPAGMKEVSCLSCHSPHGGVSKKNLANGKENQYELCEMCHRK